MIKRVVAWLSLMTIVIAATANVWSAASDMRYRSIISLNEGWDTWLGENMGTLQKVNVPHNWDDYYGYRQLTHGNLHGEATYKKSFDMPSRNDAKRYFLNIEGVGSCLLYTSPIPRDKRQSRMPSSA